MVCVWGMKVDTHWGCEKGVYVIDDGWMDVCM